MSGMGGMGGAQRGPVKVQGDDERYDLTLNFLEAVFGTEKKIDVSRLEECGTCNGSGAKPGTTPQRCPQCNGQGQVRESSGREDRVMEMGLEATQLPAQCSMHVRQLLGQTAGMPSVHRAVW